MKGISRRTLLGGAVAGAASASIRFARAAEPIKLGASLSLTGRFSDSGQICPGRLSAVGSSRPTPPAVSMAARFP